MVRSCNFLRAFCERDACYVHQPDIGRVYSRLYSRGVTNIRASIARLLHSLSSKARDNGIAISMRKHLFPRISFTLYNNFWDDMHVMFGAPGADSRILPQPRERDYFKERRKQLSALYFFSLLLPSSASSHSQRKRADRVIECYVREETRSASANGGVAEKNVKNALSIYLMSITFASTRIRRCNVKGIAMRQRTTSFS